MSTAQPSPLGPPIGEPLSDDELDELVDDIESADSDFDWTTGLLTAVVSGPDLVPPSEWIAAVFGEDAFADIEDANRKLGRMMRWYNEIVATMLGDTETICPPPSDPDRIKAFCQGYFNGSRRHPQWLSDEKGIMLLFPMGVLSGELDASELRDEDDRAVDDVEARMQAFREDLDIFVRTLHEYWADARGRTVPRVNGPRIGRNDPCPCGSGKKYKKCCLQ